ncbi:MAG TPA: hypothetical protein VGC72_08575 [Candidatus Elarobacter sp.]|jgi:hypothetical protein
MNFDEFLEALDRCICAAYAELASNDLTFERTPDAGVWSIGRRRFVCEPMIGGRQFQVTATNVSMSGVHGPLGVTKDADGVALACWRASELDPARYRGRQGAAFTYEV